MKIPEPVKTPLYVAGTLYGLYLLCKTGRVPLGICKMNLNSFGSFLGGLKSAGIRELRLMLSAPSVPAAGSSPGKAVQVAEDLAAGTSGGSGGSGSGSGSGVCGTFSVPFVATWQPGSKQSFLGAVQFTKLTTILKNGIPVKGYKGRVMAGSWANYPVSAEHGTLCRLLAGGKIKMS